jgi:hypothetical protein
MSRARSVEIFTCMFPSHYCQEGKSAVHYAAEKGHLDVLTLLQRNGGDVNTPIIARGTGNKTCFNFITGSVLSLFHKNKTATTLLAKFYANGNTHEKFLAKDGFVTKISTAPHLLDLVGRSCTTALIFSVTHSFVFPYYISFLRS